MFIGSCMNRNCWPGSWHDLRSKFYIEIYVKFGRCAMTLFSTSQVLVTYMIHNHILHVTDETQK